MRGNASTPDPAERPGAPAGSDSRSAPADVAERPIRNPLDPRNPLAGIYLAVSLFELTEGALRFLVPVNLAQRGLGPEQVGLVIAAFSFTSLLARGVAGGLYTAGRAKRIIILAGLASTIAYLLTPFQTSVVAFTALMAVDGFAWGMATTALLAVMMTSTPRWMSPAVAMGWFVGFQSIAYALATTVGGLLGQVAGVQTAMLILATVPVAAASLIAARLPPPVRLLEETPADVDADEGGAEILASVRPGRLGRLRSTVAGAVTSIGALPAAVWAAAVVAIYVNVMNGLLQSFYPLLGLALGLSVAQIGTLSSIRSTGSAVARFGAGWLFARVPARILSVPLLTLSASTIAALPSIASYVATMPLFAANGAARGLLRVTSSAAAMEALDGRQAGLAAAAMSAGLDIGKIVGPLIGGFVAAAFGLETMFRVVPLSFLALYLGLYLLGRRRRRARAAAEHRDGDTAS